MYNLKRNKEHLYSSMRFQGDGRTVRVPLTFDLREGDGLAVDFGRGLVNNYKLDDSVTPKVLVFDEPLPDGETVTIRRLTYIEKVPHIFQWLGNAQGGADFSAVNIDENFEQITRASQDAMDAQVLASQTVEEMAGIRDDAIDARDKAKKSEVNAKQSELNSKDSELNAKISETNAKSSETKARASELNAKDSENKAKLSETNSKDSEVNAQESENKSKQSELNAKASETSASADASQVAQDKVYVTSLKEDVVRLHSEADVSADNAKSSEIASKGSEELARKWAANPVDVEVDTGEYSAYHWASKAKEIIGLDPNDYRKKDDLLFKGMIQVQATDNVGTGVFLLDKGGNPRGQMTYNLGGLQFAQHHDDGSSQTFTLPKTEGELVVDSQLNEKQDKLAFVGTGNVVCKSITDDLSTAIIDSTPVGIIHAYVSENPPNGTWLLCRGQAFSAESYPDLAQLLPDLKIPDLRGVALRGLDANRGFDPNRELLSYQEDAMQRVYGEFGLLHTGTEYQKGAFKIASGATSGGMASGASPWSKMGFDSSLVTRTNAQDETVMKNVAVNFIIKAR